MRYLALLFAVLTISACQTPNAPIFTASKAVGDLVSTAATSPTLTPSEIYTMQETIINKMNKDYPQVKVDIVWRPCGSFNSFYNPAKTDTFLFPPTKAKIELCTEMSAYPGAGLLFAAHEFGHAMTDQITDTMSETDADEIGALALINFGYQKELLEAALYFKQSPQQAHEPGDEHMSHGLRAWFFTCIESGSEVGNHQGSQECVELYHATSLKWFKRFHDPIVQETELPPDLDLNLDL